MSCNQTATSISMSWCKYFTMSSPCQPKRSKYLNKNEIFLFNCKFSINQENWQKQKCISCTKQHISSWNKVIQELILCEYQRKNPHYISKIFRHQKISCVENCFNLFCVCWTYIFIEKMVIFFVIILWARID